jgi:hypothetical protein
VQVRLHQDVVIRTAQVDELAAAYARIYAPPRIVVHDRSLLNAVGSQRNLGRIRIGYGGYGVATSWAFPSAGCFLYLLPLGGHGEMRTRSRVCEVAPGRPTVLSPGAGYDVSRSAAYEALSIKIERSALNAALEAMTGRAVNVPLVFEPQSKRDAWASPLQNYARQLVGTLERTRPETLPGWWLAQTEHMLAVLVLSEERHNYSYLFDSPPADPSREQVRRAEEYIEANKDRAVTVEDLASACDVSVLSLYRAFKRVRSCSPLQFAARLRAAGRSHHLGDRV